MNVKTGRNYVVAIKSVNMFCRQRRGQAVGSGLKDKKTNGNEWSDLGREGLGVNSNYSCSYQQYFFYLRAHQVLDMVLRTWNCSLAHWDRRWGLSGVKCTDDQGARDSGCFQAFAQDSLVTGARRPSVDSSDLDGFLEG